MAKIRGPYIETNHHQTRGNAPRTRPRVLREHRLFKLRQTRGNTPRMRVSRLLQQREVRVSTSKSASLQQSESCVSTSKITSILACVLTKQESCASVPSESYVSILKQVCVCNAQSRVSTSSERCIFTLKETRNLATHLSSVSSTKRSLRLHLEVCVISTK